MTKCNVIQACENCMIWLNCLEGKWQFIYVIFNIGKAYFYEFFRNILRRFLSEVISETSQAPIKTFCQHFEQKRNIFSDI